MVLDFYYMNKELSKDTDLSQVKGAGNTFYSLDEVRIAFNEGQAELHAPIKLRVQEKAETGLVENKIVETTVGRALFNEVVPEDIPYVNLLLTQRNIKSVISGVIEKTDFRTTAKFLDDVKDLGFEWTLQAG